MVPPDYESRDPPQDPSQGGPREDSVGETGLRSESTRLEPGSSQSRSGRDDAEAKLPEKIGRFSIRRRLGMGSFGEVLLAHDDELDRLVALKFPRLDRLASPTDLEGYIAEARSAARLKHPGIVSVYDVTSDQGRLFLVLEYVEGCDLAEVLRCERLPPLRCVEMMLEIADAASYAHERGLVHRDLKPANILLDSGGHPHIADFGLAVQQHVQRLLRGQVAGTPYYMSPEQVRGETHRLDGRTDIWSMGVMLYRMLTGQRPFSGETTEELFDEIEHREARPPRQIDRTVPKELERICLKCLSKRMTDRYSSAADLVADLRRWREEALSEGSTVPAAPSGTGWQAASSATSPPDGSQSSRAPVKVIPKGLRSFDADDAEFFLELLPGPFDRDGLPESVRFWKTQLEQTDPDKTFAVGLLYGPSGCGKSSLVRAGLIPWFADHVHPVYVEAAPEETEPRLMRRLRRVCRDAAPDAPLVSLITSIREGQVLARGEKVVIILDQFEQWLHAWQADHQAELPRALRQCDGRTAQCLLLVRDGFGMSAMRLMRALEIPVIEGKNYATVDRFDLEHAVKVLGHFGRAFGRLPEDGSCTLEQERFLREAVESLAEEGQVVPVRLALFADMCRGKPWNLASLRRVGGAEGIGVAFLEETLGASATNPTYRLHQRAARRVLDALLPEPGTHILGRTLSRQQLLEVSGYAKRPRDFDDLLRILDSELRLITPIDPQQAQDEDESAQGVAGGDATGRPYQLTHDYLVPSLRQWLTRKQRETMRGRASLLLASQAELWNARPERRYLPSFVEWATISLLTRRSERTECERKMMRRATRVHLTRFSLAAVLFLLLMMVGLAVKTRVDQQRSEREDLRRLLLRQLFRADWKGVPEIIEKLEPYQESWHDELLRIAYDSSEPLDDRTRAHLALARYDPGSVPHLMERLWAESTDGPEYRAAFRVLSEHYPQQVMEAAEQDLSAPVPDGSGPEIEGQLKRRAVMLVALLRLGKTDPLWPALACSKDPRLRTLLIHRMYPCGVDVRVLEERLTVEKDPSIRQAILLAVGEYPSDGLPEADRGRLVDQCLSLYRSDPDPGVHSGAEWALRRLGRKETLREVIAQLAADYPGEGATPRETVARAAGSPEGGWYVNSEGHTMIVVPRGSSLSEGEDDSTRIGEDGTIGPTFAMSAHEVTIEQYKRFREEAEEAGDVSPDLQCPMNKTTSWYDAARYCRWLSEKEGIDEEQMCFPAGDEIRAGMTLPDDCLRRTGYRLPSEAEWEFACRAGTVTSRFFGETVEMLPKYAWYDVNSEGHLWPVGSLKPNPWGFFDIYGNVSEWCHERFDESGAADVGRAERVLRGGAYRRTEEQATSHKRVPHPADAGVSFVGFRIARTIGE